MQQPVSVIAKPEPLIQWFKDHACFTQCCPLPDNKSTVRFPQQTDPVFPLFQGFGFHSDGGQAGEEPAWDTYYYLQGFIASGQSKTLKPDGEAGLDPGRVGLVHLRDWESRFHFPIHLVLVCLTLDLSGSPRSSLNLTSLCFNL